jgi:hypothetical protein
MELRFSIEQKQKEIAVTEWEMRRTAFGARLLWAKSHSDCRARFTPPTPPTLLNVQGISLFSKKLGSLGGVGGVTPGLKKAAFCLNPGVRSRGTFRPVGSTVLSTEGPTAQWHKMPRSNVSMNQKTKGLKDLSPMFQYNQSD